MKSVSGKKGMIPRIRELLGAGKSDEQIMALVKPTWPICTPYEIGYARTTQTKNGKQPKGRRVEAAKAEVKAKGKKRARVTKTVKRSAKRRAVQDSTTKGLTKAEAKRHQELEDDSMTGLANAMRHV